MKRVVASSHVHRQTKTSFRYEATWHVAEGLLTWTAQVSRSGRRWSLAGGLAPWSGGDERQAVCQDIARSIDGLEA